MNTAAYRKTPQGEGYLFDVTPAPKVMGGCSGVLLALLILVPISLVAGGLVSVVFSFISVAIMSVAFSFTSIVIITIGRIISIVGNIISVVVGIVVFLKFFKKFDMRKKNHRQPSSFFVSSNAIEVNGKTISKSNIHRVVIRNAYDNTSKIQLTGQTVSTGVGIGHDIRNALEQISYSVDVEAGGKATQLAGGMDEVTANGLLTEVNRILGFNG